MYVMAGEFITLAEAARRAKVSRSTIRGWLNRGKLRPQIRPLDGRVFVDADELRQKTTPPPAPADK